MSPIESTYKSRDVEETIDIYFYRPLGYLIARFCRTIGITPNAVTITSIIIGVAGGHLMYYRDIVLNAWGFVLWVIADTLDSTDGQLARMINHRSKIGRILDGLGSNLIFLSIYVHLMARMSESFGIWWGWFCLLVLVAGVSHSVQSALADYYRNAYLKFVVDSTKSELEGSDSIRAEYEATFFGRHPMKKILLRVYLNYTVEQEAFSRNFQKLRILVEKRFGRSIPGWFSDEYRAMNKPLIKYYNVLTTNTRMIIMFFCVMLDLPIVYFLVDIFALNLLMVLVTMHQEKLSARLIAMVDQRKGGA